MLNQNTPEVDIYGTMSCSQDTFIHKQSLGREWCNNAFAEDNLEASEITTERAFTPDLPAHPLS